MSLEGMFSKMDEILDKTNQVMDTANNIMDTANNTLEGVNDVRNHYKNGKRYLKEQSAEDDIKVQKINRKTNFVVRLMLILWAVMIIGTIVLCVMGNDIVLQVLHL